MHGDDVDASFCGRDSQNGALPATVPEESEGGTSAPPVRIKHANVAAESSKDLAKARQSKLGAVLYSRNTTLREKRIKAHEKLQAAFRAAQAEVTEIEKKRVERTLKRLPVNQRGSFKERMDLEMAKRSSSGELVEKPLLQKEHTRNDGNLSEAQRLSDLYAAAPHATHSLSPHAFCSPARCPLTRAPPLRRPCPQLRLALLRADGAAGAQEDVLRRQGRVRGGVGLSRGTRRGPTMP